MTIRVEDVAGNVTSKEVYFQVQSLRPSIVSWKQNVLNRTSDNDLAQSRLDAASEKLDLALLGFDNQYFGNMLLALEDAHAKIREASVYDNETDFDTEALLVSRLATEFFDSLLARFRREFSQNDGFTAYNRSDGFLSEADASINLGQSGDAFLSLANAFFWMEEGKQPYEGVSCAQAHSIANDVFDKVQVYIDNNTVLPGDEQLTSSRDALAPAISNINLFRRNFCSSQALTDLEHVNIILALTNTAENLKEAENQTAWVRNYQWGMTNTTYYFAERGLNNASSFFDENHPIINQGYDRLARANEMREEFRADDFMDLLIESRCTTIAVYNLVYRDQTPVPDNCCASYLALHDLDNALLVPENCQP
jgi:hypothetical protein